MVVPAGADQKIKWSCKANTVAAPPPIKWAWAPILQLPLTFCTESYSCNLRSAAPFRHFPFSMCPLSPEQSIFHLWFERTILQEDLHNQHARRVRGGSPLPPAKGAVKFTTGGTKWRSFNRAKPKLFSRCFHPIIWFIHWIPSVLECNILLFKIKVSLSMKTKIGCNKNSGLVGRTKIFAPN